MSCSRPGPLPAYIRLAGRAATVEAVAVLIEVPGPARENMSDAVGEKLQRCPFQPRDSMCLEWQWQEESVQLGTRDGKGEEFCRMQREVVGGPV